MLIICIYIQLIRKQTYLNRCVKIAVMLLEVELRMCIHIDEENNMETMKVISIRGRMAYVICLFERLLLYFKYDKKEWTEVLKKLWTYTDVEYFDEWIYEVAEYLPDCILEDSQDAYEFITAEEYEYLYKLYSKSCPEVCAFMDLIYEIGTINAYTILMDNDIKTIKKVEEATNILKSHDIKIMAIDSFKKYSFDQCNGWGERFDGRSLSIIL